ncbi:hypothetical protein [Amycolatopsis alba]|uniref:Uncharacterized protein n=1 Tax=Amycolatopsis alba DSM 44262 TaxID=1125972 RepID=A0A229RL39_AMYAL|nr:hypothetical protein [Amycolatopsis alba]OXM47363.1 hypothetical protein CFP75_24295 [Amycolatopsis alba DSM 44262]
MTRPHKYDDTEQSSQGEIGVLEVAEAIIDTFNTRRDHRQDVEEANMATLDVPDKVEQSQKSKSDVRLAADELVASLKDVAVKNDFLVKAQEGKLTEANIHTLLQIEDKGLAGLLGPVTAAAIKYADRPETADALLDLVKLLRADQQLAHAAALSYGTPPERFPGEHLNVNAIPYSYVGFITWMAGYRNAAEFALMAYLDISLWHQTCVLLTPALENHPGGLPRPVVDYFAKYVERPATLDRLIAIAEEAVEAGVNLQQAIGTAKLTEYFVAEIWRVAAEDR